MAEYYAVLSKAVAGLEANSPDARRAVYDKARNALIGQLKAIDPPLPTAEISRQRLELEEAIRRVERETSSVPAGAPVRVAPARPQAQPEPLAAAPTQPSRPSPQDIFRKAIQEAERETPESARVERAPAAARVDTSWASERVDRVPPAARTAPAPVPAHDEGETDGPRLAPDYDYEWDQSGERPAAEYDGPRVDTRDRPAKAKGAARRPAPSDRDDIEGRAHPSRLPMVLLSVLIVAMLGGLGALGWSQRAMISEILSSFDSGSTGDATQPPPAPEASNAAVPDTAGKDTGRLLSGGDAQPAEDVRVVNAQPDAGAQTSQGQVGGGDANQGQQVASATTADQGATDSDALVAQRAVLYEEPLDSAAAASGVIAINAAVTWSYLPNGINGPEIVGKIEVPERGMKIKVAIRRNTDESLPASHVVEVVVDTPADFPGQGVKDVPRLVLKPTEDARGQPLIGASAKVAPGFFWIALSGVDTDVKANLNLMKDRLWIDLPMVYETGQRAILTFEKGTPGERVFERALTAWAG